MSSVTIDTFRTKLPLFEDSNVYDDITLQFWLDAADLFVGEQRWGDVRPLGIQMYVAHMITVDALMAKEVAMGGIGGLRGGMVTSESGDSVSVSYDLTGSSEADGGHWNQTVYGRRYIRMMRLMGAGPVQVGVPSPSELLLSQTVAWPGPSV